MTGDGVESSRRAALLLLGPSGSGKSPLGDSLEQEGFCGRRSVHFDFGANLRRVADGGLRGDVLSYGDVAVVRRVLRAGALLEDKDFPIAEKILLTFIQEKNIGSDDIIVLNGLPRHPGQARDLESALDVLMVVNLECPASVVRDRIRLNSGGDRTDRVDDSPREVENRLRIFKQRTAPLLDHYRTKGVKVHNVAVAVNTTATDILRRLPVRMTRG